MKKIVLTFGFISGAILSAMMAATVPFVDKIGFDKGMIIGYTTMVLSFLLVFFGVRSYRENVGKGEISFPRALGVGLLIMVIACACYVATWEIVYFKFLPDFGEKYSSHMLDQLKASGASAQEIETKRQEFARFRELYANPFFNSAVTFLEPLPVGLPITLLSAALLRKKQKVFKDEQQLASG